MRLIPKTEKLDSTPTSQPTTPSQVNAYPGKILLPQQLYLPLNEVDVDALASNQSQGESVDAGIDGGDQDAYDEDLPDAHDDSYGDDDHMGNAGSSPGRPSPTRRVSSTSRTRPSPSSSLPASSSRRAASATRGGASPNWAVSAVKKVQWPLEGVCA